MRKEEVATASKAIQKVLQEGLDVSAYFPLKLIGSEWSEGDFGSVEWYLQKAVKRKSSYGMQYNVTSIFRLCEQEIYQKQQPHLEFGLLSKDLYAEGTNFVYGETHPLNTFYKQGGIPGGCVLSVFRQRIWFEKESLLAVEKTCMHELAHVFWIPQRENLVEDSLGIHCVRGDCIMGQSNVKRLILWEDGRRERRFIDSLEIARKAKEREKRTGSCFCQDCLNELIQMKRNFVRFLFNKRI